MSYDRIVISSGHGKYVRGASGILDEVDEARRVVEQVAEFLREVGCEVKTFHDDASTSQGENLERIVDFHNTQSRDLDVSIHFNAYVETTNPMGTECLYVSQSALAESVANAVAACGFVNRGGKKRTDLYFLNYTDEPAVLIETCFVDSTADADVYKRRFTAVCTAIAAALRGDSELLRDIMDKIQSIIGGGDVRQIMTGKCSWFGGPNDEGVAPDEGLAFIYSVDQAPYLFLGEQPQGTTGLARRLNPEIHYIAMRFDYNETPKAELLNMLALVRNPKNNKAFFAHPADWGPHEDTDRLADLSPGLLAALGLETDDEVEVLFPLQRRST